MSSVKVESAAIDAVRNLINLSNCMTANEIKEGDKSISFDGYIPIYLNDEIKKENFYNKIDIQVKGRSVDDISSANELKFSMEITDIKNYKKVGGVIIIYVQVNRTRSKSRMYIKALLPYEINQILNSNVENRVSLSFEYISEDDFKKLEQICFQFQSDKDKQFSYKDKYMTIENFVQEKGKFNFGIPIPSIITNPIDYLDKKSFIYFQPDRFDSVQIPCGIAELNSLAIKRNMGIKIGSETINTLVEIKHFSNHQTVNINDCIFYDSSTNMFTFKLESSLKKAINNANIIKKFIAAETVEINTSKLSIKSGGDYSILEQQMMIIDMLAAIVKTLDISSDPIIDFNDINSIRNIELIYTNIIEKKGIPFKNKYDVFLLKINAFNVIFAFSAQKRDDSTYDLYNLYDLLVSREDMYSCITPTKQRIILYPNFSIFNKTFKLDVSYLVADNVVHKLEKLDIAEDKVINNSDLEANLTWFILDGLEYYNNCPSQLLLEFLERVAKSLLKSNNTSYRYIYCINYFQILKRLNKLEKKELDQLVVMRDESKDLMIKICSSILLEDENGFSLYFGQLESAQKELLKSYPIFYLLKKDE